MIIRRYISKFMVDDNNIIVDTALNGSTVKSVIARGGTEDTDVANLMVAHKATANSSIITATSPPITVDTLGQFSVTSSSSIVTSAVGRLSVPTGNAGTLRFSVDPITIAGTPQYSKNGGTWTNITDGATLSVADNDQLQLRGNGMTQGVISGAIFDNSTSKLVDSFRFVSNVTSVLTGTTINPCTVNPTDPWTIEQTTATVTTNNATVTVPSGNSGQLKLRKDSTTSSGTVKYSKNGGAYTSFSDGDIITLVTNDTLKFQGTIMADGDVLSGHVTDVDTNTIVAYYSLSRVTFVHEHDGGA